jgi:hypothetical protein
MQWKNEVPVILRLFGINWQNIGEKLIENDEGLGCGRLQGVSSRRGKRNMKTPQIQQPICRARIQSLQCKMTTSRKRRFAQRLKQSYFRKFPCVHPKQVQVIIDFVWS